jgi:hypothetical protein
MGFHRYDFYTLDTYRANAACAPEAIAAKEQFEIGISKGYECIGVH